MNIAKKPFSMNKIGKIVFLNLVLLNSIFFQSLGNANSISASEHYQSGEYEQAFYLFRNLAYTGDKGAQFNVGVMYLKGQ